jgi:hypothetical protein
MVYMASATTQFASVLITFSILYGMIDMYQQDGGWPWDWSWTWRIGFGVVIGAFFADTLSKFSSEMIKFETYSESNINARRRAATLHVVIAFAVLYLWRTTDSTNDGLGVAVLLFLSFSALCKATPGWLSLPSPDEQSEKNNG